MDGLEEKFTRCPQCRSYSIASIPPKISPPIVSRFVKQYNHYHCRNCGLDFKNPKTEENQFLSGPSPLIPIKSKQKWLYLLPVIFIAIILIFYFYPGTERSNPEKKIVENETKLPEKPLNQELIAQESENDQPDATIPENHATQDILTESSLAGDDAPTASSSNESDIPAIEGIIDLAGSNRFGVNWVENTEGLVITRLSNGPFLNAGIKIGDKITLLNGVAISNQSIVKYRNNLISGLETEGLITVVRDNTVLIFKMINSALPPLQKETAPAVLLFPKAHLKIRSSSPHEESESHRWVYNTKSVTLTRKKDQRLYISGSAKGLSPWAVDNILLISRKGIPGLKHSLPPETTIIPEALYKEALDISEYFPPQTPVEITFSLVDLGVKWGNSDIFLYIR